MDHYTPNLQAFIFLSCHIFDNYTQKKYHGLQNIWLYEYIWMQYVKRNKKASVLKN